MALEADYQVDRRQMKRRLAFWRTLAIVVGVALVAVAVGRFTSVPSIAGKNHVSRLDVSEIILDDARRLAAIEKVMEDDHVKALIVRIDSPGGTVVGGEALYKALRKVAEKKPVVAVMGQLATSAGYMVALAADRIYAHEGTVTGSIGVLFQSPEVSGLLDKLGISMETVRSGELKARPNPFEKMSPEVREATQKLVSDMYDMFLEMVIERRDMDPAKARDLADGRVYTGRMAAGNGLVDEIGNETEARRWLETAKNVPAALPVRDVRLRREVGDWLDYAGSLAGKTLLSERLTLDGLVSVWHPRLQ